MNTFAARSLINAVAIVHYMENRSEVWNDAVLWADDEISGMTDAECIEWANCLCQGYEIGSYFDDENKLCISCFV